MTSRILDGRAAGHRCLRRGRGDRGAGTATALVLLFAFTAGGVIWLARDVDRAISTRGAAQSIAFQAARRGAQEIDGETLRASGIVVVSDRAAREGAAATAHQLFEAYGLDGVVADVAIDGSQVTVTVQVTEAGRTVTGVGAARAVAGGGGGP